MFNRIKKILFDKKFYKLVFKVTLPIMLQQMLINIVILADNIMLGLTNDDIISGVYIASKIIFVLNLTLFGSIEGASIYFAQFVGSEDKIHVRQCFNFKAYSSMIVGAISMFVLLTFGKPLALLFVNETQASIASNYMNYFAFSIPFLVITNVFGTSFREIKKAKIPMLGSLFGLITNICLNYVFIFRLGLNEKGAAIASIFARFVECSTMFVVAKATKPIFLNNMFRHPDIDKKLFKELIIKSLPLFVNEFIWSLSQTVIVFAYTKVCDNASSALSISQTLFDFFYLSNIALGNGIAVIMGLVLGSNRLEEVKSYIVRFIFLAIAMAMIMGILLASTCSLFAKIYEVSEDSRQLAITMCYYSSLLMVLLSLNCTMFFMIRSGGLTAVVLIFDSLFVIFIQVPLALLLAYKTNLELQIVFLLVNAVEIIKLIIGSILLKSGIWIKNLTNAHAS